LHDNRIGTIINSSAGNTAKLAERGNTMDFNKIASRMMDELDFRMNCIISYAVMIGTPATSGEFINEELRYEAYGWSNSDAPSFADLMQ
jgi:hypothetical protein